MAKFLSFAEEFCRTRGFASPTFVAAGSFKETFLTTPPGGNAVALKIVDPEKADVRRSDREFSAMQRCKSPYIGALQEFGTFTSQSGVKTLFILEEFFDGGTLTDRLQGGPLTPDRVKHMGHTVAGALDHLYPMKLVHRDIKPDNLMFRKSSEDPVLVDFGIVRDLSLASLTNTWFPSGPGTAFFASPEQLTNDKPLIDWRSDQFSLGIVLAVCLTAKHPFQANDMSIGDAIEAVSNRARCSEEFRARASESGCSAIVKMIAPWPHARFNSPGELLRVFQ